MKIKENLKQTAINAYLYLKAFCFWLVMGAAIGALCGVIGAAFSHSLGFVTNIRQEHSWLIFLLPLGGLATVFIYRLCRVTGVGTNQVFEAVRSEKKIPVLLTPAVFIGTAITHLFGGSAGREGAALQIGSGVAALVSKIFGFKDNSRHILTVCGMGALFSALFGTPIGACVFALEVVTVGQMCSAALFPALVSSLTAYGVATFLGAKGERFHIGEAVVLNIDTLWRVAVIGIVGALVSVLFCKAMHFSAKFFEKFFKNPYLRISVGATAIIILTLLVGNGDYNGGGMEVIERIFSQGEVKPFAFLLKIIFTAITIGCGFKGGEIVPTLFIGATLGGALAILLGISPGLGAAVGIAALLCGVTNCPFATLILSIELFGTSSFIYVALAAVIGFLLSGYESLYTGQKILFSKLTEEEKK